MFGEAECFAASVTWLVRFYVDGPTDNVTEAVLGTIEL